MIARLAFFVVLIANVRAHAQPVEGMIGKDVLKLEIDDCPVQTVTADKLRQIGSEHYSRGEVLYAQGDYRGAVDELAAAYCLAPFYSILKDIGLAYERELDFEKAIAYLERYVMAVPRDAKPANACAIDPQEDKKNVLARIRVLQGLEAHISIETEPNDAQITLSSKDTGVTNRTTSGHEMKVLGGHYTMTVERPGFKTKTRDIKAEIGKPYEYFEKLEPQKGRLYVRVVPSEARLYLDRQPFGTGTIATELEGGHYQLLAESEGRLRVTKDVEVIPDRETSLAFELPPEPELGRRQFLAFSVFAGGFLGGGLAAAQNNNTYSAIAAGLGAAGGFAGAYFGTPENLALGTSSLAITSSAIGGGFGAGVAAMFTNDGNTAAPVIAAGVATGGSLGYYLGDKLHVSPGDAAVINSGALWGTVTATLFSLSFNASTQISGGVVLSGTLVGTAGGVLLQRYATISRQHSALIDASGVVGIVAALATVGVVSRADNSSVKNDERTSNFALGGLAAGLIVGGVLTRHIDERKVVVTPTINRVPGAGGAAATTFGLAGTF